MKREKGVERVERGKEREREREREREKEREREERERNGETEKARILTQRDKGRDDKDVNNYY